MIIDCISDLHGHYPKLEGGDLLIVAGDLTARDTFNEFVQFTIWLNSQQYKKIIYIAGNHDNYLFSLRKTDDKFGCHPVNRKIDYLCDSGTEFEYHVDGFPEEDEGFLPSGKRILKIWGSPWTKTFEGINPHCKAFTVDTEEELAQKWALIPDDIDILITHSPVYGILDLVEKISLNENNEDKFKGSTSLRKQLKRIKPQLHVCGHIHECGGHTMNLLMTYFINASHVNEHYEPVNKPIRIIL